MEEKDYLILREIRVLFNYIRRELNSKTKEFGISGFQSRLLEFIYFKNLKNEEVVQKDLERIFNSSKSNMCELLISMENSGLINRIESSTQRAKKIICTTKGIEMFHKIDTSAEEVEEDIKKDISKSDLDNFNKVIEKMITNLGGTLSKDN